MMSYQYKYRGFPIVVLDAQDTIEDHADIGDMVICPENGLYVIYAVYPNEDENAPGSAKLACPTEDAPRLSTEEEAKSFLHESVDRFGFTLH